MLENFNNLSKNKKTVSIIVMAVLLIFIIVLIAFSVSKNPIIGKWETDYEYYDGGADENVIHLAFYEDGTFTFNKSTGGYTARDGLLILDFNETGYDPRVQEYKIIGKELILDQAVYLKKVNQFEKTVD